METLKARIDAVEARQDQDRTASGSLTEANNRLDCEVMGIQLKMDGTQESVEGLDRRVKELSKKLENQKESLNSLETKASSFMNVFLRTYVEHVRT